MEKSAFPQMIESGGVVLTLTPDEAYIEFKRKLSPEEIEEFLRKYQLQLVKEDLGLLPRSDFNGAFSDRRWVRLPAQVYIGEFIERLLKDERVRLASPIYHRADFLPGKTGLTFSEFLLVRFKSDALDREIAALIRELGTEDASGKPNLLGDNLRRLRIREPKRRHALDVAELFAQSPLVKHAYPDWGQLHSAISATIPNDTYWANQWNMVQIGAPDGWDLSVGANTVVIAILDTGCDLSHEDLSGKYVPVADRRDVVASTDTPEDDLGHGTCCAGIAAAESNNNQGVAGVAWNCRIMPIRTVGNQGYYLTESEVVSAINWARLHGAHVISMSWHHDGPHTNADTAINDAHGADIVLMAASGNFAPMLPPNTIHYPASHALVMAVGASDQLDQRCVWDAWQASQFGPELDVVAPGIATWSTDRSGSSVGYNDQLDPHSPPYGDAAGNYYSHFGGTSGATPHVAGVAALLRSLYPSLTNDQIRSIIEKTAEKVGGYVYTHDPAHPSGTWNNEMGYGRINVFHALDFAEAYIKDNPADDGRVPFIGNFYNDSDIIVRQTDDGTFAYEAAKQGQTNYIYVRVNNLGPATARNVRVSVRAVRFPGTEFVYPSDWTAIDADHMLPTGIVTNLGDQAPGTTSIAKFSLSAAQVNQLYGWETGGWHPCLLAEVQCDNDYGTPVGIHTWLNNNLAQRNLTKIQTSSGSSVSFPFVAGNKFNRELYMELVIDRQKMPREVELLLDPWDTKIHFPSLELTPFGTGKSVTFLDKTRLAISACGCDGILTLEAGSSFRCGVPGAEDVFLKGAKWVERQGKKFIAILEDQGVIGVRKRPGEMQQMSLTFRIPGETKQEGRYQIDISQRNTKQEVVGGVTLIADVGR